MDLDPRLVQLPRANAQKEGVEHLVEFRGQDELEVDVSPAAVVTLYLSSPVNNRLKPGLSKQLKPGSRVVSHDFAMKGWSSPKVVRLPGGLIHQHTIYLWRVDDQLR